MFMELKEKLTCDRGCASEYRAGADAERRSLQRGNTRAIDVSRAAEELGPMTLTAKAGRLD